MNTNFHEHQWECLIKTSKYIAYICTKCGKINIIAKNYIEDAFITDTFTEKEYKDYVEESYKNIAEINIFYDIYKDAPNI